MTAILTLRGHLEMIRTMTAPASSLTGTVGKRGFLRLAPRTFETPCALAERTVLDLQARCRRQERILVDLERHHVPSAAEAARELLDRLEGSLRLAQRALRQLRDHDQTSP